MQDPSLAVGGHVLLVAGESVGGELALLGGDGTHAQIWTSASGSSWNIQQLPASTKGAYARAAAQGARVDVAIGGTDSGDPIVWVHKEGAWSVAPTVAAVFEASAQLRAVTAFEGGFIIVGSRVTRQGTRPALWISPDGMQWVPVEVPPLPGRLDEGQLSDVASIGGALVAVGTGSGDTGEDAIILHGDPLALRWSHELGIRSRDLDEQLWSIIPWKGGVLASGSVRPSGCATMDCARGDPSLWSSSDGEEWRNLRPDGADPTIVATAGDVLLGVSESRGTYNLATTRDASNWVPFVPALPETVAPTVVGAVAGRVVVAWAANGELLVITR